MVVDLTREALKQAPWYDPAVTLSREMEIAVYKHSFELQQRKSTHAKKGLKEAVASHPCLNEVGKDTAELPDPCRDVACVRQRRTAVARGARRGYRSPSNQ